MLHLPCKCTRTFARVRFLALSLLSAALLPFSLQAQTLSLADVRPGMTGYAYTIFEGDQVEKFDLRVIGVVPNFLGPRQSIILVQLLGPKVEHTGVVAGMSGSPVFLEGKLAGALSLKLGVFTKEPIAGVTPIEDILANDAATGGPPVSAFPPKPAGIMSQTSLLPAGSLQPIETPLIYSGFQPGILQSFAPQLASFGFVAAPGGTASPRPDDAQLRPGEMAGMVLVQGDASINSACTVTAVHGDRVYLCGHPFLSLGNVSIPLSRSRVVMTLASDLASTKIVNVGAPIGTIVPDRLPAVVGKLGPPPPLIPMDLTLATPGAERKLHYEIVNHPKLTPLLVAITTLGGLTQNALYSEGTTLHLQGDVRIKGHSTLHLENSYAPGDTPNPDGFSVAVGVQNTFARFFTNTLEAPAIEGISLRVESVPGRASFSVESAWLDQSEARPGDTVRLRVLLRPYRGEPRITELALRVPEQVTRGTPLRVLVGDADSFNRTSRGFFFGLPAVQGGLEQLIAALNRERRNDRLYAGLFLPSPGLVLGDQELPSLPLSQLNVLDSRSAPGAAQFLRESLAGEVSVALGGPVSGAISLNLVVR